jgi:hypothetical protein
MLEAEDVENAIGGDGDALMAIDEERHRVSTDGTSRLKVP